MQKNFLTHPVFFLFAVLAGGMAYCADKNSHVIKNLSVTVGVCCPILLTVRYHLNGRHFAGNTITGIPVTDAVLQVISTNGKAIKTGLPQQ